MPQSSRISHLGYVGLLAGLFAVLWVFLAIEPVDRADWALENALVVLFAVVLIATYRRLMLSLVSYTLIFVFLCLHEVGAHYTYSHGPYDAWFEAVTGTTLNEMLGWERAESLAEAIAMGRTTMGRSAQITMMHHPPILMTDVL